MPFNEIIIINLCVVMASKQHKISPELKQDILRRVKEEGIPVSQAAKEHGLHPSSIYNWLGVGTEGNPSFSEIAKLRKENRELMEIIGELTVRLSHAQKKS